MSLLKSRMDSAGPEYEPHEIRVLSEKPEDAAKYANAIARVYRTPAPAWRERSGSGVTVLEQRFNEQEAKITKARVT